MAQKYTLTVNKQAAQPACFMVYQNDPGSWNPHALPLAWFAKLSHLSPTSKIKPI